MKFSSGLNSSDRKNIIETLGLTSISKVLGNPYPLGGHSGIEMGVETNLVNVERLSDLGNKDGAYKKELIYYNLIFGKGLYHNIDFFFQFAPLIQEEKITSFGSQIRWMFFESQSLPASLSLIIHNESTTFDNLVTTENLGFNLVESVSIDDVSLFVGIGQNRCQGTFIGGAEGITDTGETIKQDYFEKHSFMGLNIATGKYFLAAQLDRFVNSQLSFKLGLRF